MKLRQISFKLVSLVMVLAILFSVSATTISAAAQSIEHNHTEENTDEKIYVSLGDSMTNGYGLPGYDGSSGVEDYGNGSYANIFAEYLNADKHYQLAMSAMRSEDLHWLLEFDYTNPDHAALVDRQPKDDGYTWETKTAWWTEVMSAEWNATFTTGDYWTWLEICNHGGTRDECTVDAILATGYTAFPECYDPANKYVNKAALIAKYYQDAVEAADVISLGMGNGNFGVFAFGRLLNAIGFDGTPADSLVYNVEDAIRECSPEMQAKILELKAEIEKRANDYLADSDMAQETVDALVNSLVYTAVSYVLNYAGSVEAILQLNPDAEIVLVGLMNTFTSDVESDDATIGDLLGLVFEPLNVYIAGLPAYMQVKQNSVYADAKFYYAEAEYVQCLVDVYESEINNPESVIRDRFVESIVGTYGDGMIWSMMPGLDPIVIDAVEYYEGLSASEKIDLGMEAYSVIVYLAFEQAILEAVNSASVSIESVLGLGNVSLDANAIIENKDTILAEMMASNVTKDADGNYTSDAYFKDAGRYVDNYLTDTLNASLANFGYASYEEVDLATLYGTLEQVVSVGMVSAEDAISLLALYIFKTEVSSTCSAVRFPATAKKNMVAAFVTLGCSEKEAKVYVDAMYNQVDEGYTGAYTALATKDALAQALVSDEELAGLLSLFGRCVIGNGLGGHPSAAGHEALADAVITAYDEDYTALDETVKNVVKYAEILAQYVADNYEEIYADVHTELREQGVIAELNAALDAASAAVVEARNAVDAYNVIDSLTESKALLLKELDLVEATIAQIKVLVNYETITEENLETLEVLLTFLNEHLTTVADLAIAVGVVADAQLQVVVNNAVEAAKVAAAELASFIETFVNDVYNYVVEMAPVAYEQFVNALVDAIAVYSHEAAKLAYNWLINNPEKVIEFFDVYGDDIADFIVENNEIIFGVIGYVGMNYGEDILYLVLDNADVILPAIAGWFEIHGDLVWDLIVVYFNAIVEYYNLGLDLDFSSPEGIHASLNKIFALLGDLLAMIKDGVYDYVEALGIVDQINKQLAILDAQIRHQVNTIIDAIQAHVEEKIAEITAQINKQIAILKEQLKDANDELKAEIEKQIEALEKELENLVNAEIENAEDLVVVLGQLLQDGTFALGEFIYDAIVAYVNDAIRGEFTPNEETIYVSVNSGNAYYAELLADALANVAKGDITFENTVWGDLNYDLLANADLVTIGYNESELTAFAIAQLLGYVHNYVDEDLRASGDDYLDSVFTAFDAYYAEIKDAFAQLGADIDFDFDPYKALVSSEINGILDILAGNTTVPAEYEELLGEDMFAVLEMANGLLGDATVSELDWAKYVGEDNLHYVDELRAAIREELLAQGVIDTYSVEIPVVEYVLDAIFGESNSIKLDGTPVTLNRSVLEEKLASVANYTLTVPVVDTLVFAIESYIYSNVEFNYNYGKLIVDLYEINPDAIVVLLGHYNAFDFELGFGGESIDLGGLYNYVAKINSVQPFAYALLSEKVAYVDISDAETYYESFINAGVDNSLVNFVIAYLNDSTVTDVTEAGNVYIYEQIMSILTLNCDHVYDNACDTDCNKCGAIREVAGHVYVDGVCINCGAIDPDYVPDEPVIPDAPTHNFHVFDDCNDATCNECAYVRVVVGHVFDDCVDATCYMCDYVREEVPGHVFGTCGEDTCERCGKTRPATTHVYNNVCDVDCNRCGETREVPAHVYSGCTDMNCNNCGAEREASAHVIDNKCTDNICNVCGQNVAVAGHVFGAWTVTVEPTRKAEGQKTRTCTGCGLVETATIDALGGIGGGAIAAIATGSVAVSGAGGFGIYWFLIQKKTFAQLLAALGKGAVATAAVAGEAGVAAAEAGAVAAEAAAEAGAEAAAEATAEAAEAAAETIAE